MCPKTQDFPVNFSGQPDTKTDPFQVAPTDFLVFNNSVRTTGGRFQKRNGFQTLITFSSPFVTNLAVFSGGLIGIGSTLQVYSTDTGILFSRGAFQPIELSTLEILRNSATQSTVDVAVSSNGLSCVASTDSQSGIVIQVIEQATGNVLVPLHQVSGGVNPRVFVLGGNFIIIYRLTGALRYVSVSTSNPSVSAQSTITPTTHSAVYEAFVSGGILYFAYNSTDNSGQSYALNTISSTLVLGTPTVMNSLTPALLSVTVDSSGSPVIWVSLTNFNSGTQTTTVTAAAFNSSLTNTLGNTTIFTSNSKNMDVVPGLTSITTGGHLVAILGQDFGPINGSAHSYTFVSYNCTTGGSVSGPFQGAYGLVIAGKPFINPINNVIYYLGFYPNTFQPTYFMVDIIGNFVAKLAYSNGGNGGVVDGGVYSSPNQSVDGNTIYYGYLYQDLLLPVNKVNGAEPGGIYTQSGANIATFTFNTSNIVSSEIGGSLQISGGFLWMYDGQKPVEQSFAVWPDPITATAGSGGSIASADQPFFYQVTYEWTDAAGNIQRSAPSIPIEVSGLSGSSNSVTLDIPALAFTAKTSPNPVRLVVYRWSESNQVYYQISNQSNTSGNNPLTLNDPTATSITFTDVLADSSIIGNNILYTTGGVIEDIGGPATSILVLFDTRLWLVDAEDPNLLWFSKQVIEGAPVETSDALTLYVAPTTSSQASTGPITALAAMDDKLIIFKGDPAYQNAIYYVNGTGPDNTGANNQYSQPIFITSAVGCANQKSIVLTTLGLMFQSSQGIWLLDRSLQTSYIGAPMEAYNSFTVTSALSIPNTTQIRFTLSNGTELVYDYFFQKWDTCTPPAAISSVVYQGLHTFLDSSGNLWQEDAGSYLDGSMPVNLNFTTPWYNLAGLQGYERAYEAFLMGTYLSPHILTVQVYYNYSNTISQTFTFNPNGLSPNGSASNTLEQFRIQFKNQKCQSVKFTVTESFDSSFGGTAGAGLTLSGINFVLGIKKAYTPIAAARSAG